MKLKRALTKLRLPIFLLCALLYVEMLSAQTNLALLPSTQVSTSYVSTWERLAAVNDGFAPSSSTDRSHPIYGNWNGENDYGKYNWIQYEWNFAHKISAVSVYWFTDFGGLAQPTDAYIEYWDGLNWKNGGKIATTLDQYNTVNVDCISKKIRIFMKSSTSTGVIEFQVLGIKTTSCDATSVTPKIQINDAPILQQNYAVIRSTEQIKLIPEIAAPDEKSKYIWNGPNGFSSTKMELTLSNLRQKDGGTYSFIYINNCGTESKLDFYLTIKDENTQASTNTWPTYTPTISYNFKKDYPDFPEPTKNLDTNYPGYSGCNTVRTRNYGAWTFVAGPNANSLATDTGISFLLKRMDDDFRFLRDNMGWPPDKLFMNGYRSAVYLFGSGLCTDNASNTELGGWQSGISTQDGESWPIVLLSYYPVNCFDPNTKLDGAAYQRNACVHEGIHAIFASLPGCREAAWFHEGSNVWLQTLLDIKKSGANNFSTVDLGWLSMGSVLAPFIPIECYSGWLQDGSFGGPAAQGVESGKNNSKGEHLILTRNIIGGVQYSSVFPTFLGEIVGEGSVPWIWKYCKQRVLEGIADSIGASQVQQMIREYRARIALADLGRYSPGVLKLYRDYMGTEIVSEQPAVINVKPWKASPYAKTAKDADGYLIPDTLTLPGWSGANIIPIHATGEQATVFFQPLGENMSCQLCYRTKDGKTLYGQTVYAGDCTISFEQGKPANGVVFAVVCNTNFKYEGEKTRTAKYKYKLKLGEGALRTASTDKSWWDWTATISDITSATNLSNDLKPDFIIYPNPSTRDKSISVHLNSLVSKNSTLIILNQYGQAVFRKEEPAQMEVIPGGTLHSGLYIVAINDNLNRTSQKLVIQ